MRASLVVFSELAAKLLSKSMLTYTATCIIDTWHDLVPLFYTYFCTMNWIELLAIEQIDTIREESHAQPVVIFKHSTRCSISSMAKGRLDRSEAPGNILFYYLDLIKHRDISNKLSEVFHVHHESPQILMIKNGDCVYDESHGGIIMEDIILKATA